MLFHSNGADTRRVMGKREATNNVEKNSGKRKRNQAGWKSWSMAKKAAQNREC